MVKKLAYHIFPVKTMNKRWKKGLNAFTGPAGFFELFKCEMKVI